MKNIWKKILLLLGVLFALAACSKSVEQQAAEQLELGQRYLTEGKYEEAIVAFNKVIELDEKNIEAYLGLGSSYEGQANLFAEDNQKTIQFYEQAAEYYEKARELGGGDKSFNDRLASVWLEIGQRYFIEEDEERAVAMLQKAMEVDQENVDICLAIGQVYENYAKDFWENNREKALQYYDLAAGIYEVILKAETDNSQVCEHLINIYEKLGDLKKIKELLELYDGEPNNEELKRNLESWRICIDIVNQIGEFCTAGAIDEVFLLMQSDEYQQLQKKIKESGIQIFDMENGMGVGFYSVSTENYGNCMIYYGSYNNGLRQGEGYWMGYNEGNNYQAYGEWVDDVPEGNQEVREWKGTLNEDVETRVITGTVSQGVWNGSVQWKFERTDGTVQAWTVSFEAGKWVIIEESEDEDGIHYRAATRDNEGNDVSLSTKTPDKIEGIEGFR